MKAICKMTDAELSDEVTRALAEEPDLRTFDHAMRSLHYVRSVLGEYRDRHRWIKPLPKEE